jgi:hypothetical protein
MCQLTAAERHVRAHHDQAVPGGGARPGDGGSHRGRRERRLPLLGQPGTQQSGTGPVEQPPPARFGAHRGEGDSAQVVLVNGVDDHVPPAAHPNDQFDQLERVAAHLGQSDPVDLMGRPGTVRPFRGELAQVARGVPERRVSGEAGLACREPGAVIEDPVHGVDRHPPGIRKGRHDHDGVNAAPAYAGQRATGFVDFVDVVTPQRRVTAADDGVRPANGRGMHGLEHARIAGPGVGRREAARVGEHTEAGAALLKRPMQVAGLPAGEDRQVRDGLRARRVVVEHHDRGARFGGSAQFCLVDGP